MMKYTCNLPGNPCYLCGNGILEGGEQCDDGNQENGDGCNDLCQIESGYSCCGSECQTCDQVLKTAETKTSDVCYVKDSQYSQV